MLNVNDAIPGDPEFRTLSVRSLWH